MRELMYYLIVAFAFSANAYGQGIQEEYADTSLTIDGKTVIVEQEIHRFGGEVHAAYEHTLKSFVLKDEDDNILFSKEINQPEVTADGFREQHSLGISKLKTPEKEALSVSYGFFPSAPGTGVERQFFVWNNEKIVPLSESVELTGSFGDISRKHTEVDVELTGSETSMLNQHSNHHYYLNIPLIINLDPSADETFRLGLPEDPQSNLRIIPVQAELHQDFISEEPTEISMYKSAIGSEKESITVSSQKPIEIGPAYGNVEIKNNDKGVWIYLEVERLQIRIDGVDGFIEEADYQNIGLPAFG